ncbi:MAG: hypothetical protein R6U13_10370 [Desulfatiglandaceae bacterium]
MIDKITSKLEQSPEWIISFGVFSIFCLVNISYTGPTVLNDEIGYLSNASLIAGYVVDGASKYHAGYSFFLAPLFRLFSEPILIWKAAMILNALIWATSFLLLASILRKLAPEYTNKQIFHALLISALYPAWITMSGYVFCTTGFVFVYLFSVLTFLNWNPDKIWTILPPSLAIGYLYWIHPIGLAVCVASFIFVSFVSLRERKYVPLLLHCSVLVVLSLTYKQVIEHWLVLLATAENQSPAYHHYPSSERIFKGLFAFHYWLEVATKAAGQMSYLIISSFGFILFGFISSIKKVASLNKENNSDNSIVNSVYLYLVLSLMGATAMGVLFFSLGTSTRIDQWIYGRYAEMVVLPLIPLGYLVFQNKKVLLIATFGTIVTGYFLNQIIDLSIPNLSCNIPAFWPQSIISNSNYFYWMVIGSILIILIYLIRSYNKWTNITGTILICIIFVFTIIDQFSIHMARINTLGTPSEFVEIIRYNYPPGTSVGVGPRDLGHISSDRRTQKFNLHLFHLYDYNYRRMSYNEWLSTGDGPYLTFDLDGLEEHEGIKLLEVDLLANMYMIIRNDDDFNIPKSIDMQFIEFID